MLTQKQESFCLAYIETGNATEAYRRAYGCAKQKPETINRNAKTLIDNSKIIARLEELRAPAREKALITYESHLDRLRDLSEKAERAGQFSASITAEVSRGKVAGLYIERQQVSGPDGAPLQTNLNIRFVGPDAAAE